METIISGNHTFEVVESVPRGYSVWMIGKNMIDGYLPLCRLSPVQPFEGGRNVEIRTLKAIKTEGAQTILAACGYGAETVKGMEKLLNGKKKQEDYIVEKIEKALPFMREIKGL